MQLVVGVSPEVAGQLRSPAPAGEAVAIRDLLAAEGIALVPQFPGMDDPSLSGFFTATVTDHAQADDLAARLLNLPGVDAAYVKADPLPPMLSRGQLDEVDLGPSPSPGGQPSFIDRQGYLDPAPRGVDAKHAWTLPGGRGEGVRIA